LWTCFGCLCERAEPAIDFVLFEDLPSRRALDAFVATGLLVFLQAIISPPF